MSSSKRETILEAAFTALGSVSGTTAYRSRAQALSKAETPALILEPLSETAVRGAVSHLEWDFLFSVTTMVRSDTPDITADPIITDVHAKIMQSATLQALVIDVVPSQTTFQISDADTSLILISQQFRVSYQTGETTIT